MFAVPGWAVSAESLAPTDPNGVASASNQPEKGLPSSRSNSKKRKRDELGPVSESRITSEDLHRLWSKEFNDTATPKQKTPKPRNNRKRSDSISRHGDHANKESNGGTGDDAPGQDKQELKARLKRDVRHNPQKKRKKQREMPSASKHTSALATKINTPQISDVAPPSEHGKVQENSAFMSKKKHIQRALEKTLALPPPSLTRLTPLQAKMRDKLTSARFRHLNETLYTSPSSASFDLFSASPDLFAEYHAGFAQQVKYSWPENPVDGYVRDIKTRAQVGLQMGKQDSVSGISTLPRRKTGSCTIADLGCGDAPLARALQSKSRALNLKFHNFDLYEANSLVTKADIASLPLRDGEADVAIFCLSLMGTNWLSFIEEAWRVLRGDGKGELWVAEVKSRFGRITRKAADKSAGKMAKAHKRRAKQEESVNLSDGDLEIFADDETITAQDETDISAFVTVLQRRGFALQPGSVNKSNKMFVSMILNKSGIPSVGKHQGSKWNGHEYEKIGLRGGLASGQKKYIDEKYDGLPLSSEEEAKVLKPCVYKKR
jgi:ribosomal RNA-processing protein 8